MSKVQLFYWGEMLGRAGGAELMLAAAGVDYEHVSDFGQIASKCAVFGAPTDTLAPPVIVDGDVVLSQSVAVTQYVGQKHFPAPDDNRALMLMLNVIDLLEGGLAQNKATAEKLKVYLEGAGGKPARFAIFLGALERAVEGPYFFGEKPSYVDFLFTAGWGWATETTLAPLSARTGVDYLAPYPKLAAVVAGIEAIEGVKALGLPYSKPDFRLTAESPAIAEYVVEGAEAAPAIPETTE